MNKRKRENGQLEMQQTNNKPIKYLYNANAITLIALVISIIVMLILAGVSLNATIGENGIMTQAKNATYMQGIATLEEYLQSEYVKYYDESAEYTNKIELLASKMNGLLLKDGSKNYVVYEGKMYYLLNKQALPEEIRNQLRDGDTTEYSKYIRLQNVYGITENLKVYYCNNGTDNVLGSLTDLEIDPNTPLTKINNNSELKDAISSALNDIGINVDEEKGITIGNVSNLKNITIDGSETPITSLAGISELTVLQNLNLKNITVSNLDGIEACNMLKSIYFEDCVITDENGYDKLSTVLDLQELYFRFSANLTEEASNKQIEKMCSSMSKATELNKLEKFGIFGTEGMLKEKTQMSFDNTNGKYLYNSSIRSNVTNISNLTAFANNIKNTIKIIYLNNNNLNSIESLKDFNNIEQLYICCNYSLKNVSGLENHKSLKYVLAQYTSIENLLGLSGCTEITNMIVRNTNLQSLNGIESTKLILLDARNSKLLEISALENCTNLEYLQVEKNENLQDIKSVKKCQSINNLYMAGNTNLDETVLSSNEFQNIIKNCGTNYSLDGKYGLLFLNQEKVDLTNSDIDDSQLELLRGKSNIKAIKLTGNTSLSNNKIEEILSTLTELECISLVNMSQVTSINFVKSLPKLVSFDLRGTSVSDLSVLENLAKQNKLPIGCLFINNENIDVTTIQKTISSVSENSKTSKYDFITAEDNSKDIIIENRGIAITNPKIFSKFSECTEITAFVNYLRPGIGVNNQVIDLSNCNKLTKIQTRGYNAKFIIPNSCKEIKLDSDAIMPDLSNNNSLTKISISWVSRQSGVTLEKILNYIKTESILSEIGCYGIPDVTISNFSNLKYTKVKTINLKSSTLLKKIVIDSRVENITNMNLRNCTSFESINSFENLINLNELNLDNTKVQSLQPLNNHKTLKVLYANNTNINSLSPLENVVTLNSIYAANSKLSNLNGVEELVNLEKLDVSGNSISNLYSLSELAKKNNIKLNDLDLSNNLLENNAIISKDGVTINVDNIEIIKELNKLGLKKINISGNNFSDTSAIKNLKWDSYIE